VFQIPLMRGRGLTDRDESGAPPVALINEAMARQISPSGDALNERISQFPGYMPEDDPPRQIIGIVRDVRDGLALSRQTRPTVYVPMAQMPPRFLDTLVWIIRARTDPSAISSTVAMVLQQTSAGLPVAQIRTMDAVSADATARTRFLLNVSSSLVR
jgi:hypothetical protein